MLEFQFVEEWYNYQNFALWYDTYINSLNPDFYNEYQIDKDLFQRGEKNKVYSPHTCCIILYSINTCINYENMSNNKIKENNLPTGVHRQYDKYYINMSIGGSGINGHEYLGS